MPLVRVELWVITATNVLDVLKHVAEFGAAIAYVIYKKDRKGKDLLDVGLVLPYHPKDEEGPYTHRQFLRHIFTISWKKELPEGLVTYDTPISPYAPGDGGEIPLESCWYVPKGFRVL